MTEQRNLARFATIANAAFNSMTANSTAITSMSIGGHTINATSFAGTANNATNLGGVAAASYQLNSTLAANVATLTSNNTSFVGTVTAANVVSNAQLSANLANYQTTAGLAANVATLTANNASFLGGTAAASYQLNSTLSTNVATMTANNASNLGGVAAASYQLNSTLSANVATMTANNSTNLNGQAASFYTNATNLTSGTLPDARLSSSVVLTSGTQAITAGAKQFNTDNVSIANSAGGLARLEATGTGGAAFMSFHRPGVFAAYFGIDSDNVWKVGGWSYGAAAFTVLHSGNFSSFTANNSTNLNGQAASFYTNASNLSTGTVPTARLGSGTANTTTFLRGDQTWGTAGGGQIQDQLFTSSGSWTVPAGVTRVRVLVIGGGGGGSWYGTSGGSGGIARGTYTVTPGNVITVTVGAGGNGMNSNGTAPSGGTSSFGAFVSATGGGGGFAGGGPPQGGAGGAGSGGTIITGLSVGIVGSPFGVNLVRASRTVGAISWNTNVAFSPGAGGARGETDSYSGHTLNNASGGVGGIVYIEWVG